MAKNNDYFYIKNISSDGKLAISKNVFYDIISSAIKPFKDIRLNRNINKKKKGDRYSPITCRISRDNKINIDIDVAVKKGANVKALCLKLKEEIESEILLMCETVPVNVNVNVANIDL